MTALDPPTLAYVMGNLTNTFRELATAVRELNDAMRPKHEAESWPVYLSEYLDVMCGLSERDCSCYAESSIIFTPYDETDEWPKFTVTELVGWIEAHIEEGKQRKAEKLEEEG